MCIRLSCLRLWAFLQGKAPGGAEDGPAPPGGSAVADGPAARDRPVCHPNQRCGSGARFR
ncbi:hypothetical protein GCM10007079_52590 [Nocardiopsis terrae]|nr:hypothetical protein GCM10007079_52590 [Nocardiopsis terrae]